MYIKLTIAIYLLYRFVGFTIFAFYLYTYLGGKMKNNLESVINVWYYFFH